MKVNMRSGLHSRSDSLFQWSAEKDLPPSLARHGSWSMSDLNNCYFRPLENFRNAKFYFLIFVCIFLFSCPLPIFYFSLFIYWATGLGDAVEFSLVSPVETSLCLVWHGRSKSDQPSFHSVPCRSRATLVSRCAWDVTAHAHFPSEVICCAMVCKIYL